MAWQSALQLAPDYVRAIGMISIENANLESALGTLFSRVIGSPDVVGRAVYLTPKSASARCDIFKNAAKAALAPGSAWRGDAKHQEKMKAALQQALKIVGRAEGLIGQRHGIIHDQWGIHYDEIQRRSLHLPAKTDGNVPLAVLEKLITDFRLLIDEARSLADEFRNDPPHMVDMRLDTPPE